MSICQSHYEELLARYSHHLHAIALLKQYRPYLETVPSMRRSEESLITIPLPVVQVRRQLSPNSRTGLEGGSELIALPCDLALLMCDPEWKVKTGVEILIFIHRPMEDFSQILGRWRQTQVLLSRGYCWEMPLRYQHIFSESAEKRLPLFVLFNTTPERVKRGLQGAFLPFVVHNLDLEAEPSEVGVVQLYDLADNLEISLESDSEFGFE